MQSTFIFKMPGFKPLPSGGIASAGGSGYYALFGRLPCFPYPDHQDKLIGLSSKY
jgi:hypothetical protein